MLRLTAPRLDEPVSLVRVLVQHGMGIRAAYNAMDALTLTAPLAGEQRPAVPATIAEPSDPAAFESRLAELGVRAERRVVPGEVDVPAIRKGLGLSQEEFALRFGLDVGTLRGWEQGRFKPDRAARVLLQVIAREPAAVERALADRPEEALT